MGLGYRRMDISWLVFFFHQVYFMQLNDGGFLQPVVAVPVVV